MVTDMACPKCGGRASEYDANKWACLSCANKFIYTPPPVPQTFLQTNVNIQGSPLFELKPENAQKPQPFFDKKIRVKPGYFDEIKKNEDRISYRMIELQKGRVPRLVYLSLIALHLIITGVILLATVAALFDPKGPLVGLFVALGFFGIPLAILFKNYGKLKARNKESCAEILTLQNRNQQLAAEKNEDAVAGHKVLCPYCSSCFATITFDGKMPAGLNHCLSCGKQFFTANGYSYPLAYK